MTSTSRTTPDSLNDSQADEVEQFFGPDDDEPEASSQAPVSEPDAAPSSEGQPPASDPAPADATDSVPAPDGQPTPTPAETPVTASAPTTPPVPDTPSETPTAIKADGRELPIPGVMQRANGDLVIPAASRNALQMHLADRRVIQQRETEHKRQLADLQQQVSAKDQTAQALVKQIETLLDANDLNAVADWVEKVRTEFPRFMADARVREQEAREQALQQRLRELELERERPNLEPAWQAGVKDHAASLIAADPDLTGLDPAVVDALWAEHKDRLVVLAPADDPAAGIRKGEPAVQLEELRRLLIVEAKASRRIAAERQKWEQERAAEAARQQARTINAAATQPPKAPTTVTAVKAKTISVKERSAPSRPRNPDGTFAKTDFDKEWADFDPLAE